MAKNLNQTLHKLDQLLNTKVPGRYLGPLNDTNIDTDNPGRPRMNGLLQGFASWLEANGISSAARIPNDILETMFCSKVIFSIRYKGIASLNKLNYTKTVDTNTLLPLFSQIRIDEQINVNDSDTFIKWRGNQENRRSNEYAIFIAPSLERMGFIFMSHAMNEVYDNLKIHEASVNTMITAFEYFDSNIAHTTDIQGIQGLPNTCTQITSIDDGMDRAAQLFHFEQSVNLNHDIDQTNDTTSVQAMQIGATDEKIPDPYAILPDNIATSNVFWESSIHAFFPDSTLSVTTQQEKKELKRFTEKENKRWQYNHSFKLNNEKIVIMTKPYKSDLTKVCAIYPWCS